MTTKAKLIAGLSAIFVAGIVVGGSAGYGYAKKGHAPKVTEQRKEPAPKREFAEKWCSRLIDDLGLTPEQVGKIKPITEQTSAELKLVNAENHERVRAIFKASHEKIKTILTPEQLEKFEQRNREREMRYKQKC